VIGTSDCNVFDIGKGVDGDSSDGSDDSDEEGSMYDVS